MSTKQPILPTCLFACLLPLQQTAALRLLLENIHFDISTHPGADLKCKDKRGRTCAHLCCVGDHPDILHLLFSHQVSLSTVDDAERTPLHYAALNGSRCASHRLIMPLWLIAVYGLLFILALFLKQHV